MAVVNQPGIVAGSSDRHRKAAVILPGRLPSVVGAVLARDLVDTDLDASEADVLSHVRASAIEAVCLRMMDALDRETLMEVVQRNCSSRSFAGVDDRVVDDVGRRWMRRPGFTN